MKESIDWHLADEFGHRDVMLTVRKLNEIYRRFPSLHSDSKDTRTFEWVNRNDSWANTVSFIRRNPWNYDGAVLVICNFSPVAHYDYTVGVPIPGIYTRVFSTFDTLPGGGSPEEIGSTIGINAVEWECDGRPFRLTYSLRPGESVIFKFPW